jgi:hypothetical protein
VEEKIVEEIQSVRFKNQITSEAFYYDDLREMNYISTRSNYRINEIIPTSCHDSATCKEDDFLPDGTFIGKRWIISYSAHIMCRIEDV